MRLALAAALITAAAPAPGWAAEISNAQVIGYVLALTSYVDKNCPTMRSNMPFVKERLAALGAHERADLVQPDVISSARSTFAGFEKQSAVSVCQHLWSEFGAGGTGLADLLLSK